LINSNIEADFKTHHDVEIKELESEIQRLRTEKITIQMENEQLYKSLKCMEDTNKKLKSIYDERLDDKDKIINNLQDRIQNFLYDGRGHSWNNVPPSPNINKSHECPRPSYKKF
jgi:regulator of replication initiation timing